MHDSPFISEVTAETFAHAVLETSHNTPVLVDFWAEWCGPCRMLMPVLAKLADDYAGRFRLAKVNTDQTPDLAAQFGVRSLPTVKLFKAAKVVDEFMGAQPEGAVRAFLDRHLERDSDVTTRLALDRYRDGDRESASADIRSAIAADPTNDRPRLALARILIETGELDAARSMLRDTSASTQADAEFKTIENLLIFADVAKEAPPRDTLEAALQRDPEDSLARYRLGARLILAGDFDAALQHLLEIVRRDRAFQDDAGRRGLLGVFGLLDKDDARVVRYRGLLARAIH